MIEILDSSDEDDIHILQDFNSNDQMSVRDSNTLIPNNESSSSEKNIMSTKKRNWIQIQLHSHSGNESNFFTDIDFPPNNSSITGRQVIQESSVIKKICKCQSSARLRQVSKDGPNQGRYFYSCALKSCNYFSWDDGSSEIENNINKNKVIWKRFNFSGWKFVNSQGFSSEDVVQGSVGDCWFLSAVAVISTRKDLIEKIFPHVDFLNCDEKGISVNLFLDGIWKSIIVDNYLPMKPKGNQLSLAFCGSRDNQLWVSFLEKAYAKAHGSYHAISGGYISEAMLDLTGYPCEEIDFSSDEFNSDEAWIKLISYYENKFPMGCSTSTSGEGIVGCHAYSILEVKEIPSNIKIAKQLSLDEFFNKDKGFYQSKQLESNLYTNEGTIRVLRLRNPWARYEWKGDLSYDSDLWNIDLLKYLDRGKRNDGTFWITYHDFLRRFESIEICKAREDHLNWFVSSYNCNYKTSCHEFKSFDLVKVLPLIQYHSCETIFQFKCHEPIWFYLTIIQNTKRGRHNTQVDINYWYSSLSIVILQEVSIQKYEVISCCFTNACRNSPSLDLHLLPGSYHIIPIYFPSTTSFNNYQYNKSIPFTIRLYSSHNIQITSHETKEFYLITNQWKQTFPAECAILDCIRSILFNSKQIHNLYQCFEYIFPFPKIIDLSNDNNLTGNMKYLQLHVLKGNGMLFLISSNHSNQIQEIEICICFSNHLIYSPFVSTSTSTSTNRDEQQEIDILKMQYTLSSHSYRLVAILFYSNRNEQSIDLTILSSLVFDSNQIYRISKDLYLLNTKAIETKVLPIIGNGIFRLCNITSSL